MRFIGCVVSSVVRRWNLEITSTAIMFEFFSKELFDDTLAEAKRYDGVLYAVPSQKLLFVDPSLREGLRDFIQQQREQRID